MLMPNQDSDTTEKMPLVDIKCVQIDKSLPVEQRITKFVEQVGNPYRFMCGDTPVEIVFSDDSAKPLARIITDYLISKKSK